MVICSLIVDMFSCVFDRVRNCRQIPCSWSSNWNHVGVTFTGNNWEVCCFVSTILLGLNPPLFYLCLIVLLVLFLRAAGEEVCFCISIQLLHSVWSTSDLVCLSSCLELLLQGTVDEVCFYIQPFHAVWSASDLTLSVPLCSIGPTSSLK